MHALLLAAGLSTRLGALSEQRPKPLLPVCNETLLRWAVVHCRHAGIAKLAVNLHHLGRQIRHELADGSSLGVQVTYSPESEILGTGGGIKRMAGLMPRGRCVVANAKIVTDLDLAEAVAFHEEHDALATLVVRPDENAERWGALRVDNAGRISGILEARAPSATKTPDDPAYQFTGIHIVEPELIDAIPDEPTERCVIRTAYIKLLERGAPIAGYVHRGYFYDHSTPARYLQGNLNLLRGAAAPAHTPGPLVGIHPTAEVHPQAEIHEPVLVGAGARIGNKARLGPAVVVGPQAEVSAGVRLEQCVVWPEAVADSSGTLRVVTPNGPVEVPLEGDPAAAPR